MIDKHGVIPETVEHLRECYLYSVRKMEDIQYSYYEEEANLKCIKAEKGETSFAMLKNTFKHRIRCSEKCLAILEERYEKHAKKAKWAKKKLEALDALRADLKKL